MDLGKSFNLMDLKGRYVCSNMIPGTAAAALAGGATVAAYLNAKFHLKKDISSVLTAKKGEREYAQAGGLSSRATLMTIN